MKAKYLLGILSFLIACPLLSCQKYLDNKPDKAMQIPSSIQDLQALFDLADIVNGAGVSFDESSADNYFLPDAVYNSINQENRNTYNWSNINYDNYPNDWSYLYDVVNISNLALDKIETIIPGEKKQEWNNVKGTALFFRAYSFLQGAFIFCKAYDKSTATADFGMALRLTSDFNLSSTRATLEETYDRILNDLKTAVTLLPDLPKHVFRPSKSATYALLARTYLSMRNYDSCYKYADLALKIKNDLVDYNQISQTSSLPFIRFNQEVIFNCYVIQPIYYASSRSYGKVDSTLYMSYDVNDLRKYIFYGRSGNAYLFKGSYFRSLPFIGLATDEVLLMRAECQARFGNKDMALEDLNMLMTKRWKTGFFNQFTAATNGEALNLILTERRKELVFRNLRWMDIKRLNKEGANIILTRVVNGQTYTLMPNDKRYALALPADIITMTGMPQNPY